MNIFNMLHGHEREILARVDSFCGGGEVQRLLLTARRTAYWDIFDMMSTRAYLKSIRYNGKRTCDLDVLYRAFEICNKRGLQGGFVTREGDSQMIRVGDRVVVRWERVTRKGADGEGAHTYLVKRH